MVMLNGEKLSGMRWEKEHPNKMKSQWENLKVAETIVHLDNTKSLVWLKHSKVGWAGDMCYFCSVAKSFATPWKAACHISLSFTISQSLLKLISIESVMSSNHFILSPSSPFAFNLSQHQDLFQWVGSCTRWPKYWSFSFNISPSNEYAGLISFRIDWFDLPADQGIVRNLSLLSLPACDINHIVHSRSGRII